jgi:hypothetical protein
VTARQLQGIPPIRLHPVAGFGRNQRSRNHRALHAQLRPLPIQHISRRTRFLAGTQLLPLAQLLDDQLANRLFAVSDCSQVAHLAIRLRNREGNPLGMDI